MNTQSSATRPTRPKCDPYAGGTGLGSCRLGLGGGWFCGVLRALCWTRPSFMHLNLCGLYCEQYK